MPVYTECPGSLPLNNSIWMRYKRGVDGHGGPSWMDGPKTTSVIEGGPSGPLSPYIGQYIAHVTAPGYVPKSVRYHLSLLVHFDGWLARTGRGLDDVDEALIEKFLTHG